MRFIVALAFVPILSAQTREESIAKAENALKQHPENLGIRGTLLRLYYGDPNELADTATRAARRRHIDWLIENRPDAPDLSTFFGMIEATGPKGDPEGHDEAAQLWQRQIAKEDASPKTLANAAWFFKMSDRAQGFSLIRRALEKDPRSAEALRMEGILDVLTWLGAIDWERGDTIGRFDAQAAKSAAAAKALEEISSSNQPALLGGAAAFLLAQGGVAFQEVTGAPDRVDLAERWAAKAHELDPQNPAWRASLVSVYQREAGVTIDPRWKAHLLAQTIDLAANDGQKSRLLADLASAEFDADQRREAARDARLALETPKKDDYAVHVANTVLGEIAAADGDLAQAHDYLLASARVKNVGSPRMTLAQDLLERNEKSGVVEYLDLCRAFWKNDRGFLDHFEPLVKAGRKPDLVSYYNPGLAPQPKRLPAPEVVETSGVAVWKAVPGAESYVVEWDTQQKGRWESDVDGSLRVIPTRETSVKLPSAGPLRWRVFAVNRTGGGVPSAWQLAKSLQ